MIYKNPQRFLSYNKYVSNLIDRLSEKFICKCNCKKIEKLKILHVTNFNERFNGRLFLIQEKLTMVIRLGHSVLEFSDRDITHNNKIIYMSGAKNLNNNWFKHIKFST